MPFKSLTFAIKILWTGSESSKTTKPKFGSFPPTPLVLMRSSTTFPKPVKIHITQRIKYFNKIYCNCYCLEFNTSFLLTHFKTQLASCYTQCTLRYFPSYRFHIIHLRCQPLAYSVALHLYQSIQKENLPTHFRDNFIVYIRFVFAEWLPFPNLRLIHPAPPSNLYRTRSINTKYSHWETSDITLYSWPIKGDQYLEIYTLCMEVNFFFLIMKIVLSSV